MAQNDSTTPTTTAVSADSKKRVTRPDRSAFDSKLAELQKELDEKSKNVDKAREDVKAALGKGDGPQSEALKKLRDELNELKSKQAELKTGRNKVQSEIRVIDERLQKKIKDLQAQKGKANFKSVEEVDNRIKGLERAVDSGTLKLVEEKKTLGEISNLKKMRKVVDSFASVQAEIDSDKTKIATIRKGYDNTESNSVSDRYKEVIGQMDEIRNEQQKAYKNKNSLFEKRSTAEKARDEVRNKIKALKDEYFGQERAFRDQLRVEREARQEREKAERVASEKERKRQDAEEKLEAASHPAFAQHIATAENLLLQFDSDYKPASNGVKEVAATKGRQVEDIPANAKIIKKEQGSFFAGTGGKKKKGANKSKDDSKLTMNIGIIEDLALLNIAVPTSREDLANTITKIKEKLVFYEENQTRVTQERIDRAKAEIAKIDTAASAGAESNEQSTAEEPKAEAETAEEATA